MDGKINIFLDFDSTIVDSIKRFVELANKKYKTDKDENDLGAYGFSNLYPEINNGEVHEIFAEEEFYNEDICWMNEAEEIIKNISNKFDIFIVTSASGKNLEFKNKWISKHMPFVKKVYATGSNNKSVIDMSGGIQVDDVYECLEKTNARIKLLYKNYNNFKWQRHSNEDVYNVNSWKEINEILNFYLRNGVI